jgi:hypothetical protein
MNDVTKLLEIHDKLASGICATFDQLRPALAKQYDVTDEQLYDLLGQASVRCGIDLQLKGSDVKPNRVSDLEVYVRYMVLGLRGLSLQNDAESE